MRRTCQVFQAKAIKMGLPAKRCGEPAVDFVAITGMDFGGGEDEPELLTTRIWMCAKHWDEYQKKETNG